MPRYARRRPTTRRPRRARKSWRRPAVRRIRRSGTRTLRNSAPSTVISDRFITKMKYADRYAVVTLATGITAAYLFNLNSVYDPDRTGLGHQPWGRDQLAALYHRYRVFAVSWRVTFFATNASTTFTVVPLNNEQSTAGQSLSATREQPRAISKLSSVDRPTTFSGRITLSRLNGQTSAQYKAGDRFQALADSNPAELMTLQVCANSFTASNYPFEIQLTYHTEWFDPLPVGQS